MRGMRGAAGSFLLAAMAGPLLLGCTTTGGAPATQGPASRSVVPAGLLVGTWTKEIALEDFAAAGVEDEALLNNVGRFTRTYGSDGTWTEVLVGPADVAQINPVFRGTYAVDRDRVTMTTTFPPEYAGSISVSTWRLDGEQLWTTLVSSPDPLELKLAQALDREPWLPG
jgi:hypothetical protein